MQCKAGTGVQFVPYVCNLMRSLQSLRLVTRDKTSAANANALETMCLVAHLCNRITAKEVHARYHAGASSRLPNWPHAAISSSPLLSLMVQTLRACRHSLDFCNGTKSTVHVMALQKHTASNLQAHQLQADQLAHDYAFQQHIGVDVYLVRAQQLCCVSCDCG